MGLNEQSEGQETNDMNQNDIMKDVNRFVKNDETGGRRGGNGCLAVILLAIVIFLTIVMLARCVGCGDKNKATDNGSRQTAVMDMVRISPKTY